MLDKLSKTTLIRVVIIFAGTLYGTWHHWGHIPSGLNEAFTITLLLLLAEQFIELSHQVKSHKSKSSFTIELDTVHEYYAYLTKKVLACRKSWEDMGGIDINLSRIPPTPGRLSFYTARARLATSSRVQRFQYIGIFQDTQHFDRILELIRNSASSASCVRYYEVTDHRIPQIEVTIVDREEVIIGYYQPDEPLGSQKYIATNDRSVVELFLRYYQDLWHGGISIKEGTHIKEAVIDKIQLALKTNVEESALTPAKPEANLHNGRTNIK